MLRIVACTRVQLPHIVGLPHHTPMEPSYAAQSPVLCPITQWLAFLIQFFAFSAHHLEILLSLAKHCNSLWKALVLK